MSVVGSDRSSLSYNCATHPNHFFIFTHPDAIVSSQSLRIAIKESMKLKVTHTTHVTQHNSQITTRKTQSKKTQLVEAFPRPKAPLFYSQPFCQSTRRYTCITHICPSMHSSIRASQGAFLQPLVELQKLSYTCDSKPSYITAV